MFAAALALQLVHELPAASEDQDRADKRVSSDEGEAAQLGRQPVLREGKHLAVFVAQGNARFWPVLGGEDGDMGKVFEVSTDQRIQLLQGGRMIEVAGFDGAFRAVGADDVELAGHGCSLGGWIVRIQDADWWRQCLPKRLADEKFIH